MVNGCLTPHSITFVIVLGWTGTAGESAANNNEAESGAPAAEWPEGTEGAWHAQRRRRMDAVASANAAGLLCDLVLNGCAGDACTTRFVPSIFYICDSLAGVIP